MEKIILYYYNTLIHKVSRSYEHFLTIFLRNKIFTFISKRGHFLEPQDKEVYIEACGPFSISILYYPHTRCQIFFILGSIVSLKIIVERTIYFLKIYCIIKVFLMALANCQEKYVFFFSLLDFAFQSTKIYLI